MIKTHAKHQKTLLKLNEFTPHSVISTNLGSIRTLTDDSNN